MRIMTLPVTPEAAEPITSEPLYLRMSVGSRLREFGPRVVVSMKYSPWPRIPWMIIETSALDMPAHAVNTLPLVHSPLCVPGANASSCHEKEGVANDVGLAAGNGKFDGFRPGGAVPPTGVGVHEGTLPGLCGDA